MNEKDWKVFKTKIPIWQEAYIEKLNSEYIALLNGDGDPSEKFWKLEERIRQDKKHPGVCIELKRSNMDICIIRFLQDGIITLSDLDDFSEEFNEKIKMLFGDTLK